MNKYGDGSNNVLQTMVAMREEMERLVEKSEDLAESTWRDYADEEDLKPGGGGSKPNNKPSSSNKPSNGKYDGLEDKNDRAEYRDKQLKKLIELGNEMDRTPSAEKDKIKKLKSQQEAIAQTIGAYNQGGTWYIMINGKKYRVRDAVGVRHTGVRTGFVGNKALSKEADMFANMLRKGEEWNILDAGEIVANDKQMRGFMNNVLPNIVMKNQQPQIVQPNIELHVGSVTKETLPELEIFVQKRLPKEVHKILNDTLISKGIRSR